MMREWLRAGTPPHCDAGICIRQIRRSKSLSQIDVDQFVTPDPLAKMGCFKGRLAMETDPSKLRELASWYRDFAEKAGNPAILGGSIAHRRETRG